MRLIFGVFFAFGLTKHIAYICPLFAACERIGCLYSLPSCSNVFVFCMVGRVHKVHCFYSKISYATKQLLCQYKYNTTRRMRKIAKIRSSSSDEQTKMHSSWGFVVPVNY